MTHIQPAKAGQPSGKELRVENSIFKRHNQNCLEYAQKAPTRGKGQGELNEEIENTTNSNKPPRNKHKYTSIATPPVTNAQSVFHSTFSRTQADPCS